MRTITARVADLVEILKKNREIHWGNYTTALANWSEELWNKLGEVREQLATDLQEAAKVNLYTLASQNEKPQSYDSDYATALGMLDLHQGETIEIDLSKYRQYVEDEWRWTEEWIASNSKYLGRHR